MLKLNLVVSENYDSELEEFITITTPVRLEHSLLALSRWEEKYRKPFLSKNEKSQEEIFDYISMMVIGDPPENFENLLDTASVDKIVEYFNEEHTATWFPELPGAKESSSAERITSELIYYWIFSYGIPITVETWNLSRTFALIKIFGRKNEKKQTRVSKNAMEQRRLLNEQRKQELGTSG